MNRYFFLKLAAVLGVVAFCTTLALMIGQRLSTEAMAVLMGVIAGIAASIPTSIMVAWIAVRSIGRHSSTPSPAPRLEASHSANEPPRLIMMQQPVPFAAPPGAYLQQNWTTTPSYPLTPVLTPHSPRKFTVIGGGAESEEILDLQALEIE